MTKTLRKPVTMLLALCIVFSLAVGACADDITASGGSATSPVNLTTTNDGLGGEGGGGTVTPTRMSVTVPTALPMAMSDDGTVVTATDCKITNNSYGAVRVASVSKLVMAFGVLALCERGALNLDEDLSVYLGYPVRNPHFKDVPVTLRMLLTHTAAIRDEGNYGTRGMQKGCTLRELLENAENWLNVKPGEAFHYSNLGAGAAGVAG